MYERTAVRSKFIIAILWKKLPKIIKDLLQVAHDLRVVFFIFRKTGSFVCLVLPTENEKKKASKVLSCYCETGQKWVITQK